MPTTLPGFMNASEAAEYIGVTDSLVRRFCRMGRIKARRLGNNWAIEKKELDRFQKIERHVGNPAFRGGS